ncbi:MAG TPA: response regulator transcription factor, partial [Pyrinomonadaceae bacterium]|nr:response regulator transcription factor [Pyrinomonadaceae bacterium]
MSVLSPTENNSANILVVDDDALIRDNLREIFEEAGYRTVTAPDGPTALRVLHKQQCDLIVLDLEMPGVDGVALCRLLRAQVATSKIPVIAFSGSDDENRQVEAFAAGVDDYIIKPSTPGELLSRVNAHLRAAKREWALLGSNRELRFLSDLGRGLLRALEPEQLVRRVAGATYDGTGAVLCAAFVDLGGGVRAGCVFDREGSAESEALLHLDRLNAWLTDATTAPSSLIDSQSFFLRDTAHKIEYAAPLRFGGQTKGALVVAFDAPENCGETECRLVDAAAQQAALAAHISSLYLAARDTSASLAIQVDQRTAEAE